MYVILNYVHLCSLKMGIDFKCRFKTQTIKYVTA